MAKTTVSSKFQVVIPRDVRSRTHVRPGQVFQVIAKRDVIALVPDRPISALRGFVRGIKTSGFREKKDRF
jgi:AbrB family looped-hinge helix DNA binding protein